MTPNDAELERFEKRARELLEHSVTRIDARTRSRLNQARHAALAQSQAAPWWRNFGFAPAAGVLAVVVLALVLWVQRPAQLLPVTEGAAAVEDLDLLADGETFELIRQEEGGFYEWAVAQADSGQEETS